MKYLPETSPLTNPFKHSPRMAHVEQSHLVAGNAGGGCHGEQVARCRGRLSGEEVGEQRPDRRFAQVFGVWLECQSPDGYMASVEVAEAYRSGKKSIPSALREHVLERVGVEDFQCPSLQLLARRLREPLTRPVRQRPETALQQLLH